MALVALMKSAHAILVGDQLVMPAAIAPNGSVPTSWLGSTRPCGMGRGTGMQNAPTRERVIVELGNAIALPDMKARPVDASPAPTIALDTVPVNT
jgi:hypothetical protein